MSCEIVKNWVMKFENEFYYCRDHKCECPDAHTCPIAAPPVEKILGTPEWVTKISSLKELYCHTSPNAGHFNAGAYYIIIVVSWYNGTIERVTMKDEDGNPVNFSPVQLPDYFSKGAIDIEDWLPSSFLRTA